MSVTTIGIDIAKTVIQVHGVDASGQVVLRRRLGRTQLIPFLAGIPPCLVGIEACSSAHHWARELARFGHDVRLIPPQYVKPYVKRNKTDAADAEAIFDNIAQVASQRLHVSLDYSGCIPLDDALRQSSRLAQPVVTAFPDSPAARSLRGLAADMLHWPQSGREGGGLEQFVQQLLHLSQRITPSPIHAG